MAHLRKSSPRRKSASPRRKSPARAKSPARVAHGKKVARSLHRDSKGRFLPKGARSPAHRSPRRM